MSNILRAAEAAANTASNLYGGQLDGFARTARMWSALFGIPISAEQVVLAFMLNKISRQSFAHKEDNLVDIAGYADALADLRRESDSREKFRAELPKKTLSDLAGAAMMGTEFERGVALDALAQRALEVAAEGGRGMAFENGRSEL